MPASPARIAKSTVDGVVVERIDPALKQLHANAVDVDEIETFFDDAGDAQAMLNERFTWSSDPARLREAIEFDGTVDLGTGISLTPASPIFRVIDESRDLDDYGAVRAYAANYESDRFALELIGLGETPANAPVTIGGTPDIDAVVGEPYSFAPLASGGTPPYLFSISAPSGFPEGLSFNRLTGELRGIPTGATVGTLTINGAPDTDAIVGEPYSWAPGTTGGAPDLVFDLDGDLPPGLVFNTATGRISGTPT